MADEPAKIVPGDSAIERKSGRRWFGRGKDKDALPFTHCENCGAALTGHYCAQCGQAAIDYRTSLRHFIAEILDSFDIQSKIFGTAWLLISRPWALTNEYLSGKRVRHLTPFKLCFLASLGFFFAVNFGAKDLKFEPGKISEEKREEVAAAIEKKRDEIEKELDKDNLTAEQRRKAEQALDNLTKPGPSASASASPASSPSPAATDSPGEPKRRNYGAVGDRPFLVFDENEKEITPFERWLEARAKEKMGENGTKKGLFITTLFSYLPYMMLCCVPLFAFVLKVLYFRRRIFYIDHLVYALHIHTFFYTGIMLIVAATICLNWTIPGTFAGWIIALLWITFVVQIFLSIRYVYRQGWFISTLKFFIGGFVYSFVLLLALTATFFVTLLIPT